MIDLHTHTLFSDGVLVPSELVRRAAVKGYKAMAITDHADMSNLDFIVPRIVKAAEELNALGGPTVLPGIEITHVPPGAISRLVEEARNLGAKVVVIHGESPVEPVAAGTNLAGINAGADILAHPGFLTLEEAKLAAKKGVFIEITARKGHSLTNGHVAKTALEAGADLVVNTDAHAPGDLITEEFARDVLAGAGLGPDEVNNAIKNSSSFVKNITGGYQT